MRRQLNLLEFAIQSLLRRWQKNLALLFVYSLVVAFFSSVLFLTQSLKNEAEQVLNSVPEVWLQKIAGGRIEPIPVAIKDSLIHFRGVEKIYPRIWGYYYDAPSDAVFTILAADSALLGKEYKFPQENEALVGSGYMETHTTEIGQRFLLQDNQSQLIGFQLLGSFSADTDLLTRDLIVLHPIAARKLLGLENGFATDLAIRVINNDESTNIAGKINRMIPGVRVVTRDQLQRTYERIFSWKGGIFFFGILFSFLAFLILAWDKASGMSAEEKLELGILKGIGWQVQDVLWLKFWEALSLSLTATLGGILLAILHVYYFDAVLLKSFFIGWATLYPNYHLQPHFSLDLPLLVVAISILPYLAATLIPAWRGAITDPAQVMQNN